MTPQDNTRLLARIDQLEREVNQLATRIDGLLAVQNLLLELHGMEDLPSNDFTAEELNNAGGFLSAYLARRGAVEHLDLKGILARIQASHGSNGRRIDPALFRSEDAVPCGIMESDESGKGIGLAHVVDAEASHLTSQAVS